MEDENEDCIHKKIKELSVPILQSINLNELKLFQPYNLRYYEDKYCISFNSFNCVNNDILLRIHSNRLILVSIAEGHDIIRHKKVIEKINFNINGVNMLDISLSGKKKAGAKKLKKNSILCYLKCKDEENEYPVYSCVPASLIELNHLVIQNPQLLVSDYKGMGYIGVLYPQCFGPNATAIDTVISKLSLLSEEEYQKYLSNKVKNISEIKTDNEKLEDT